MPAGLQKLTSLELAYINGPNDKQDTLQLTQLTSLQALSLFGTIGVDDAAAAAIARSLTQLSHLDLRLCQITSRGVLQAIAQLPLLQWLDISENDEAEIDGSCLQDEDIELLLPLQNLTHFEAAGTFSQEAIGRFNKTSASAGRLR